jgi:hypothetical protein
MSEKQIWQAEHRVGATSTWSVCVGGRGIAAAAAAAAPRPAHYHLVCFAMNRRLDRAVLLGMDSLPPNERVLADGILDTA